MFVRLDICSAGSFLSFAPLEDLILDKARLRQQLSVICQTRKPGYRDRASLFSFLKLISRFDYAHCALRLEIVKVTLLRFEMQGVMVAFQLGTKTNGKCL